MRKRETIRWTCSFFPTSIASWPIYLASVASLARSKCKWDHRTLLRSPSFFGFSLRLLRFNRRLSLLHLTLRQAGRQLLGFLLMSSFVFVAFTSLFFLIFHPHLEHYSSWLTTAQTCFEMIAVHFTAVNDMFLVNPLAAGFCLFLFIFLAVFLLTNMFVSIIVDNFNEVRRDQMKRGNEVELFQFVAQKMKQLLGKTVRIGMSSVDRRWSVCSDRKVIWQTIRRESRSANRWITGQSRCIDVRHRQSKGSERESVRHMIRVFRHTKLNQTNRWLHLHG